MFSPVVSRLVKYMKKQVCRKVELNGVAARFFSAKEDGASGG